MKTISKLNKVLLFACLITTGLMSCKKDDKTKVVKVEDVQGGYSGTYQVVQGKTIAGANTEFTVGPATVNIADFPVAQIVNTVLADAKEREEAMKKIGKLSYDIKYSRKVSANKGTVDLTLSPRQIAFDLVSAGTVKKVVVDFAQDQKSSYNPKMPDNLSMVILTSRILVDTKPVSPLEPIKITFSSTKKK